MTIRRTLLAVMVGMAPAPCAWAQPYVYRDLTSSCPGDIIAYLGDLTPGGSFAVLTSPELGSFTVPAGQPCAGTVTGLSATGIAVRVTDTADAAGTAVVSSSLPAAACRLAFQVLDVATCTLGPVTGVESCASGYLGSSACGPDSWTRTGMGSCPSGIGAEYNLVCAPGGTEETVWGTDIYTRDSSVCTAAAHAGHATLADGGVVTQVVVAGQSSYTGSTRNGITTADWFNYGCSFSFL